MRKKILYLSGPISGLDIQKVKDTFQEFQNKFLDEEYNVINPLKTSIVKPGKPWEDYMKDDIFHLLKADVVAALPGWDQSNGAMVEIYLAAKLSIPIMDAKTQQRLIIECPPPYKRKATAAEERTYDCFGSDVTFQRDKTMVS